MSTTLYRRPESATERAMLLEITLQQRRIAELEAVVAEKQAEIDRLMLEYCPSEMTEEQKENWAGHQRKAVEQREPTEEEARLIREVCQEHAKGAHRAGFVTACGRAKHLISDPSLENYWRRMRPCIERKQP